jgi:hypothetical protein
MPHPQLLKCLKSTFKMTIKCSKFGLDTCKMKPNKIVLLDPGKLTKQASGLLAISALMARNVARSP